MNLNCRISHNQTHHLICYSLNICTRSYGKSSNRCFRLHQNGGPTNTDVLTATERAELQNPPASLLFGVETDNVRVHLPYLCPSCCMSVQRKTKNPQLSFQCKTRASPQITKNVNKSDPSRRWASLFWPAALLHLQPRDRWRYNNTPWTLHWSRTPGWKSKACWSRVGDWRTRRKESHHVAHKG